MNIKEEDIKDIIINNLNIPIKYIIPTYNFETNYIYKNSTKKIIYYIYKERKNWKSTAKIYIKNKVLTNMNKFSLIIEHS